MKCDQWHSRKWSLPSRSSVQLKIHFELQDESLREAAENPGFRARSLQWHKSGALDSPMVSTPENPLTTNGRFVQVGGFETGRQVELANEVARLKQELDVVRKDAADAIAVSMC